MNKERNYDSDRWRMIGTRMGHQTIKYVNIISGDFRRLKASAVCRSPHLWPLSVLCHTTCYTHHDYPTDMMPWMQSAIHLSWPFLACCQDSRHPLSWHFYYVTRSSTIYFCFCFMLPIFTTFSPTLRTTVRPTLYITSQLW